jgi:aspartyl/asparaginyl beta-hydroxylase (cupin superfamily)
MHAIIDSTRAKLASLDYRVIASETDKAWKELKINLDYEQHHSAVKNHVNLPLQPCWVKGWTQSESWLNLGLVVGGLWLAWAETTMPQTTKLLRDLDLPYFTVGVCCLRAHSSIPTHFDEARETQTCHVYHLGLKMSDGGKNTLCVLDEVLTHGVGKFIDFDDSFLHTARNDSDEDRFILYVKLNHA